MTETGAPLHQPTPASLRARIAEQRVLQWRVAKRMGVTQVHLSHVLVERRAASLEFLARIAEAVEDEVEANRTAAATQAAAEATA